MLGCSLPTPVTDAQVTLSEKVRLSYLSQTKWVTQESFLKESILIGSKNNENNRKSNMRDPIGTNVCQLGILTSGGSLVNERWSRILGSRRLRFALRQFADINIEMFENFLSWGGGVWFGGGG